jgi:hypothetical protein
MREDHLLKAVLDMARLFGLSTAHFRPALSQSGRWHTAVAGDGKGFPDLVIVGPGGILYRELKTDVGRLSPEQVVWLRKLAVVSDAGTWRPADLHDGTIERELKAIRKVREETSNA